MNQNTEIRILFSVLLIFTCTFLNALSIDSLYYFEDKSNSIGINDVRNTDFQDQFQLLISQNEINPITRSTIWLRYIFTSSPQEEQILVSDNVFMDSLIVYYNEEGKLLKSSTGLKIAMNARAIANTRLSISLAGLQANDTIFIEARSDCISSLMLSMESKEELEKKESTKLIFYIVSAIFLFLLSLIGLLVFFILKEGIFLYYTFHVWSTIFTMLAFNMYIFLWYLPGHVFLQSWVFLIGLTFFILSSLLFSYKAFNVSGLKSRLKVMYKIVTCILIIMIVSSVVFGRSYATVIFFLFGNLILFFNMLVGFYVWRFHGKKTALIFAIGWLLYFCCSWIFQLTLTGTIASNILTENISMLGICLEQIAVLIIGVIFFKKIILENRQFQSKVDVILSQQSKISIELKEKFSLLTKRETEVLEHISHGLLDKEIASELQISIHTIRTYLNRIYKKIDVNNRTEAAIFYKQFETPLS